MRLWRKPNLASIQLVILFCLFGCKSRIEQPELIDPIYLDLTRLESMHSKTAEEERKQIEDVEHRIESLEPHSLELVQARKELSAVSKKRDRSEQLARFYKIRAEKRKFEDRVTYDEAFRANETWPKPEEFEFYKQNQKLRSVSMNWQSNVPSLINRYSKNKELAGSSPKKETPKKEEHH